MKNEEWKNISGYENLYKISSHGRVKVKRRVMYGLVDGEFQPLYVAKEKIMSPFDNGSGYLCIALTKCGKRKNFYIHRLVAEHFIDNPYSKVQVNHKDYDRKNNKVDNLEWVTVSENAIYSLPNRSKRKAYKTNSGYRYITKRYSKYRVCVGKPRIDKSFGTLEEAIAFRNQVLEKEGFCIEEISY